MLAVADGAASAVRRVRRLHQLACVHDAGVEAVLLARRLPRAVAAEAAALARGPRRLLAGWRRDAPAPVTGAPALDADLALLAEVFADLLGCEEVGVRMQVLAAPMCPRWHVDRVELRLVTTYLGPGSELVPSSSVRRERLGTEDPLRPGAAIVSARTGEVVLMKGEAWDGNVGRGVVHRSPAQHGERLVVTMDPLG